MISWNLRTYYRVVPDLWFIHTHCRYVSLHFYLVFKNLRYTKMFYILLSLFYVFRQRYLAVSVFNVKTYLQTCVNVHAVFNYVYYFYAVMDDIKVYLFYRYMHVIVVHLSCFWIISHWLEMFSWWRGRKVYMNMAWVWQSRLPNLL